MGTLLEEAEQVMKGALVCVLTYINENGEPVSHPMLPLYDAEAKKLYFTSSVLFSKKLEEIKKNGKISVLFSGRNYIKSEKYHVVHVKGDAVVKDTDLSNAWLNLLPLWKEKEPYIERFLKQRYALPLFWERAVIEVTPSEVSLWREGDLTREPEVVRLR